MTLNELKLDLGLSTTTSLTFPAFPTDIPWTNLKPSGTTDKPLTINGTDTYCQSLNISIERGPTPAEAVANETFFYIKSGYRKITGSMTLYLTGKEIDTLFRAFTSFMLTFKLSDSPACDITMTNTIITSESDGVSPGENSYIMLECNIDSVRLSYSGIT